MVILTLLLVTNPTWLRPCKYSQIYSPLLGYLAVLFGYTADTYYCSPRTDLNTPGELAHTWVSLTHTPKTGLYMSMYYTPKITQFY